MAIDNATHNAKLVAYATDLNRRATFDGLIADLEQICRRALPPSDEVEDSNVLQQYASSGTPQYKPESLPWFAKEILDAVGLVRHWLAHEQADIAAAEALVVGMLAARAGARHYWPEMQRWPEHLAMLRKGSTIGTQANSDRAAERTKELRSAVDEQRRKHPDWSTNRIAGVLLRDHGRPTQDRQTDDERKKDLNALAKKISRLARK